jgi:2-polyprenyl-6-methoxyphenol hydroxylase-like FAD-dependent oxidoreductase
MSRFRHGILVVGAGIAGSTLAIALARRGIAVRIVERQTIWQPIGAGMFLYSNGLAALERAGVLADVLAAGWSRRVWHVTRGCDAKARRVWTRFTPAWRSLSESATLAIPAL